jgi:hypothetical protein
MGIRRYLRDKHLWIQKNLYIWIGKLPIPLALKPMAFDLIAFFCRSYMPPRLPETSLSIISKKSEEMGLVFIHMPKAGGSSVFHAIFDQQNTIGHPTIYDYRFLMRLSVFKKTFKFTFVRNPWSRLYSAFNFLKAGGVNAYDAAWAKSNLPDHMSFKDFVLKLPERSDLLGEGPYALYKGVPHFLPQWKFISFFGSPIVDYIGKYESLDKDFEFVAKKLGLPIELHHHNKTKNIHYDALGFRKAYTPEMIDVVAKVYKKDIELFDYTFN